MRIAYYILLLITITSTHTICAQDDLRFYSGLGIKGDLSSSVCADFSLFLLKKESKFNFGSHFGAYRTYFNNPDLATDSRWFYVLGLQAIYPVAPKFLARVDLGSRFPTSNKNFLFNDAFGNAIPDSELGGHIYLTPSIEYTFHEIIGVYAFYNTTFEKRLNMNNAGIGLSIKM